MSRLRAPAGLRIEAMTEADWPAVRRIYEEGIASGNATLETDAPEWPDWDRTHLAVGRLVARLDGEVVGWTALTPVSGRCVYGGVAELSVYVAESARRRGVGRALLERLVAEAEAAGLWTLQASILAENEASLRLHERVGFRVVGVRERLGRDAGGRWRDIVLVERRSRIVGV